MSLSSYSKSKILRLIQHGEKLPFAIRNYPSRGQTAVQDLYQTSKGKLFLKKSSRRNHIECQIDMKDGSIAEREYWAYRLAVKIGLKVPILWLMDSLTTVQTWLDFPDGRTFATSHGKMVLQAENIFDCSLFDWLTGQIDRHDANYLYDFTEKKIILVDSAFCFLKYTGSIPDYLKYFEIGFPHALKVKLKTDVINKIDLLTQKDLRKLAPLRDQGEAEALQKRLSELRNVSSIEDLIHLYRGNLP